LHGRKEAFTSLSKEIETSIYATISDLEKIFSESSSGPAALQSYSAAPNTDVKPKLVVQPSGVQTIESTPEPESLELQTGLYPEWARTAKAAASHLFERHELVDGRTRWPWSKVFDSRYMSGSSQALIVEPYLSKAHQIRNLNELILWIINSTELKVLHIVTGPEDVGSHGDDSRLRELAHLLSRERGIDLNWDRDKATHDRFVIFDTGAVFKLGRGLDIYKTSSFGLARNDPSLRKVRHCEIDVFGPLGAWGSGQNNMSSD
jgi:hypothetical protein